jgi:hypothetical protein
MALGKKTGGRKKGVPNKATAEVKALAMSYVPAVIREMARLSRKGKSEMTRVAAGRELLDRALGRPPQSVDLTNSDGSLSQQWREAMKAVDEDIQEASVSH